MAATVKHRLVSGFYSWVRRAFFPSFDQVAASLMADVRHTFDSYDRREVVHYPNAQYAVSAAPVDYRNLKFQRIRGGFSSFCSEFEDASRNTRCGILKGKSGGHWFVHHGRWLYAVIILNTLERFELILPPPTNHPASNPIENQTIEFRIDGAPLGSMTAIDGWRSSTVKPRRWEIFDSTGKRVASVHSLQGAICDSNDYYVYCLEDGRRLPLQVYIGSSGFERSGEMLFKNALLDDPVEQRFFFLTTVVFRCFIQGDFITS